MKVADFLALKFKSRKKAFLSLMILWGVCICLSTLGYFNRWGKFPVMEDFIAGHSIYAIFSLPVIFAGLISFFDAMAIIAIVCFWPVIVFFHYQVLFRKSVIFFCLSAGVLLSVAYFWLTASVAMSGI